ncbi:MAG: TIGR01777 family protein [Bdellovibrionales bacterium CG10_big_fil_rev_8_21_14_0_10_45_34]|nr:MAG: TIGR01777 family protein [Bdellovibrionales bacterium CG10_big_fil_rev_8_21_14_0_10_45_34]
MPNDGKGNFTMKILVTGATGFLGQKLCQELCRRGHSINALTRDPVKARLESSFKANFYKWSNLNENPPHEAFVGVDAIVHLMGESIASAKWTDKQKKRIRQSRIDTLKLIADVASQYCADTLKAVVSSSAIGIYGDRGDETLDEQSGLGTGFLADVCKEWEAALFDGFLFNSSLRKVAVRTGIVLDLTGGALEEMLPIFRKGVGSALGSGLQWMSWVSRRDLVSIYVTAIENEAAFGVYNGVSPSAVTNREFTEVLNTSLGLRTFMPPAPELALKVVLGDRAQLLLQSQKVVPMRLQEAGFSFRDSNLGVYFNEMLSDFQGGQRKVVFEQWVDRTVDEVFPFFADARNLEKITPPTLNFEIENLPASEVYEGMLIDYRLKVHGVPMSWRTKIAKWSPNESFCDEQIKGPYSKWVHTHTFEPLAGGCLLTDEVVYKIPLGALGRIFAGSFVFKDISKIFQFRRQFIHREFSKRT